jgi:uncharacterized membrane protein
VIAEHYARKWQAAGLIDAATAERIRAWEASHRRPVWLWAVSGMGALAIGLGMMAIVGANWDEIPDTLKLAVDLALNAICAAVLFACWRQARVWPREITALLLFGLVLSGIALIGQVYQLQSDPWRALVLWLALCTPFLALTSLTRLTGAIWALAVLTTWFAAGDDIQRLLVCLHVFANKHGDWDSGLFVPLQTYLPGCGLIVIATLRALWPAARRQAELLLMFGFALLMAACSLVSSVDWFTRTDGSVGPPALVAAAATLAAGAALWSTRKGADRLPGLVPGLALLGVSFLVWTAALLISGLDRWVSDVVNALLFIVYWGGIGAVAARAGWRGWFGFAFTMVGLRLLVLYFEAIGGLTATGFGLLGGGVLCLALAAAGWRLTRRVARPSTDGNTP